MHIPESLQDLANSEAVQFLKRPKTITRIFAGVFSLIVFSSLLTDGYQNKTESSRLHCVFNSNRVACSFAVGAGLLAFVTCLAFLALDTHESRLGSPRFKTAFQLLDCIVAASLLPCFFLAFTSLLHRTFLEKPPGGGRWGSGPSRANWSLKSPLGHLMLQAYLALQDLRNDSPVPYKRSLDEGGVVLAALPPPSAVGPVHTPAADPNSLSCATSALSPYLSTPKAPRLAMMPDN
ncbi:SNG4 protein, partial [Crocuta crocuta]